MHLGPMLIGPIVIGPMLTPANSSQRMSAANPKGRCKGLSLRGAAGMCALAGFLIAIAAGAGLLLVHAQSSPAQSAPPSQQSQRAQQASGGGANPQAAVANGAPAPVTAVDPSRQQVANEAADLLKMATALKSEVDKSTKDMLSVGVVRKANQIEQMAHKARTATGTGKG
jgi:hypothetical protein